MGTYRLTDAAEDDLVGIHQYGARQWGIEQADRFFWQLYEHFETLAESPYLYTAVDYIREGYRRSVCGAHSVYYRVDGDVVVITAILRAQDVDRRL